MIAGAPGEEQQSRYAAGAQPRNRRVSRGEGGSAELGRSQGPDPVVAV